PRVQSDLARHRVRTQRQSAGLERREDQHVRAREVRVGLAAAVAVAAVVARGSSVERLRQDRETPRYTRDVQLVARLLHEQLVAAWLRRRLEYAVRIVRQAFPAAEDADQPIESIVVGRDVVV